MIPVINQNFFLNDAILKQDKEAVYLAAKKLFSDSNTEWLTKIFKPTVDAQYLESLAKEIKLGCKHLVIIGTGASSNIPRVLFSLASHNTDLQIYFLEDADTSKLEHLISKLDPYLTRFLVISKSGRTVEILALVLLCLEWAKKYFSASELSKIFYFITAKEKNNYLMQIARTFKSKVIEHPILSGRYSFFNSLGLLPAAIAGFNINLILQHVARCIDQLFKEAAWILEGATYFIATSKRYHNAVLMTYSSAFHGLSFYFRQLTSESLGKAGQGVNPIIFEGNIDQHSQLQSYLDGQPDKFFTVLTSNINIDDEQHIIDPAIPKLKYLQNKTLSDINKLQINLVIDLLKKAGKNLRIIEVTNFNEKFISEIITCFMVETILYAKLNNINPFTQTAIDSMKDTVAEAVTK